LYFRRTDLGYSTESEPETWAVKEKPAWLHLYDGLGRRLGTLPVENLPESNSYRIRMPNQHIFQALPLMGKVTNTLHDLIFENIVFQTSK
jgi:hypothetical protein